MKYLKTLNEKVSQELFDNIKHMLLSLSDDDLKIDVQNQPGGIFIRINGYNSSNLKYFNVNDYIDEIERVIDYLKSIRIIFYQYYIYKEDTYMYGQSLLDIIDTKFVALELFFYIGIGAIKYYIN